MDHYTAILRLPKVLAISGCSRSYIYQLINEGLWPKSVRLGARAVGWPVAHEYIELGSYFSQWRLRNTLKMWTGWPTFPMVFVRGTLVGGADDLRRLIDSGELQTLLQA